MHILSINTVITRQMKFYIHCAMTTQKVFSMLVGNMSVKYFLVNKKKCWSCVASLSSCGTFFFFLFLLLLLLLLLLLFLLSFSYCIHVYQPTQILIQPFITDSDIGLNTSVSIISHKSVCYLSHFCCLDKKQCNLLQTVLISCFHN